MARRTSARLRGREPSSTPKRVSLSHDAHIRTPKTAPVKMSTLNESDEMPGAFPQSVSPAPRSTPVRDMTTQKAALPARDSETTPRNTTPLKPSVEEMHPERHYQSTAKPLDEARWLGFEHMAPHTEPPKPTSGIAALQRTPTRSSGSQFETDSPKFQFNFKREQSLELSPEAKKLMNEKREEAVKIREQMIANGDGPVDVKALLGRRMATPKGKKGRFSEVHMEEFKKMDSIANHPSARTPTKTSAPCATPMRIQTEGQRVLQQPTTHSPTKSLKRSPSKAELDDAHTGPRSLLKSPSRLNLRQHQPLDSGLPQSAIKKGSQSSAEEEVRSTIKRIKRSGNKDVSTAHAPVNGFKSPSSTPNSKKNVVISSTSTLPSPTQASLARNDSMKSVKHTQIPAPALTRTPSKPALRHPAQKETSQSTPLLARSPSKATLFSPTHSMKTTEDPKASNSPLLLRSPLKGSVFKQHEQLKGQSTVQSGLGGLLSRSPLKGSVAKRPLPESVEEDVAPATPLLARSPTKVPLPTEHVEEASTKLPSQSSGTNLLGRFNLLHVSPMKSILRTPQRLYSDDPAKVAAGTHLATPPKFNIHKGKASANKVAMTAPVQKHVDFSSSTKDRYERAQSELSSTPSRGSTPSANVESRAQSSSPDPIAQYPNLPSFGDNSSIPQEEHRQTSAPGDFTFRAGEHSITFGQSPSAPMSSASTQLTPTIRHVSAEPQLPSDKALPTVSSTKKRKFDFENHQASVSQDTGTTEGPTYPPLPADRLLASISTSKKRKFDFENHQAAESHATDTTSDKENTAELVDDRAAKRLKPTVPDAAPKQPVHRTTLGVKPKKGEEVRKEKKPSTISRARLNALAQPKRRA